MALSSALHEALREFVSTEKGSNSNQANEDLAALEDLQGHPVSEYEDGAAAILVRLYYGFPARTVQDTGSADDDLAVTGE